METNLILTAKKWSLAGQLERTKSFGGVQLVKNIPERTYLGITEKQWSLLQHFKEPRTVPQVLEAAIEERFCPRLGEFYELILKAVRARILVEPGQTVMPVSAVSWPVALKKRSWSLILWGLFFAGLGLTFVHRPELPLDWMHVVVGAVIAVGAYLLGSALAASLLRGAGAEVYFKRGLICTSDARMLPPAEQRLVAIAPMAIVSACTGFLAWRRPELSFLPLLGLLVLMRPIFGGAINAVIRLSAAVRVSDADHHYIFPPNRTVGKRWRLLRRGLASSGTWLEIGYGVLWTLVLAFFLGGLAEVPPWKLAFWQTEGLRLALAAGVSLGLLALVYIGLESYVFTRDRALARHERLRRWSQRWFGHKKVPTDEAARHRAVVQCPMLRSLPPSDQQALTKAFKEHRVGPWQMLNRADAPVDHVYLILSGQVGVYRQARSGRRILVQVLSEEDLVGLHGAADPQRPDYLYRSITPVVLLQIEWAEAQERILSRVQPDNLVSQVLKIPFLKRIKLCQNWHRQAINRFAELSRVKDYAENEAIIHNGSFSDSFYVILEGDAFVMIGGKRVAVIHPGGYFGEIGLLQNSNATAKVVAQVGTRCLSIPRVDFLRFVAHNYSVALELERVSSKRLGRPIFPLSPGNFRQL